ncbi:MAG: glutamate mutase L, partial [Candidatus Delongbacteria bacterium]|nr:glutamate mutase L [Candidatus Delongbacteria bacterium]
MMNIIDQKNILIVDIGSTTTKGLLLEKDGEKYFFKALSDSATTVERPFEDVNIGIERVILDIEKKSGIKIYDNDKNITVPFLATSSAGGGLQVLVFGLTKAETGKAVEATAYGAGAIITGSFTVDDGISEMDKMRMIREIHPDMIMMAGGIDKGGIWGILRQAEILTLAEPRSKFMPEEQIPLVFCGNIEAREFVKDILGDKFHVHVTENIRPTLETFNFDPVRKKVHQLFMENVMENAPGYKAVKKSVVKDILPTPTGVELILKKYYEKHNENTLLVDIGGATTDIFSCINSNINRTVSANVGMSYSISNILKEAGIGEILSNICNKVSEEDARNYISNKTLNPEYIPQTKGERFVELSCAVEGIKIAWEQHLNMNMEVHHIGFLDRRKREILQGKLCPFEEVFNLTTDKDDMFQFSDINKIIGAGGIISSSAKDEDIIFVLNEGFLPVGITELYVDKHFKSPQMGMFSLIDADKAVETFERESLVKVCTVLSVVGKCKEADDILTITDIKENTSAGMKQGQVFLMKKGGHFRFETKNGCMFGTNGKIFEIETDKCILLDCRGRNNKRDSSILFKAL